MNFYLHEIAIGQNFTVSTQLNGMEGEVIGELKMRPMNILNGVPCKPYSSVGYKVRWSDGKEVCVKSHHLRKKQPPQELGSWEVIQNIPLGSNGEGWNPTKIEVKG